MLYTLTKAIASALIILLVTWFGKKSPCSGDGSRRSRW